MDDSWFEAKNINALKNSYKVINNLSLKLKNNEKVAILGPNGSGKSSIVDLINRNIYPLEQRNASLKIFNKELINIWELRKKISTVNNEVKIRINNKSTVFDLIISGLYGSYSKVEKYTEKDIQKVNNLVDKMNLNNISNKPFGFLSDGEKQISLIARSLINAPEILILDEPAINLDLKSKFFLIDKIQSLLNLDISLLCITHDITMITKNYNRIILLKEKKIIADGNPLEIMNSFNINRTFDVTIDLIENTNSWQVIRN